MLNINLRLENIICKNRIVSINTIKEELSIKKNSSFIRLLMSEFIKKLKQIDYSIDDFDLNYFFRLLNYVKATTEEEFIIIEDYIRQINEIIAEKVNIFNRENNIILDFLNLLHDQINVFVIETKLGLLEHKKPVLPSVDFKTLSKITCDLIFKYKNYDYLSILCKNYPEIMQIKIKNQAIIFRLFELYNKDYKNRHFFAKVITLIISNKTFCLNDEEKSLLLKQISEVVANKILTKEELFFMKEMMFSIKNDIDSLERISMLNERYGINAVGSRKAIKYCDENRIDMRDREIITIDSNGAEILDDALSFKKNADGTYEFGVYITDLSPIEKGSKLDIHAYNRFSAIYLSDRVLHLFPERTLKKNFSLNKGLHKVMAFTFRFTPKYKLINCDINEALINITENLNHIDVLNNLEDSSNDAYNMLKCLLELSEAINDTFSSIDKYHNIKLIVRELKEICSEIPEKYMDTPGNRIVTASMIFLNQYLANYFYQNNLPFMYRINTFERNDDSLKALIKNYRKNQEVKKLLNSILILYKKSTYSSENKGHKGLGLVAYTQATSPARMYVSLYIQRMLHDLFILKMPAAEYIRKYQDVEQDATNFNSAQERNYEYIGEYSKLCKRFKRGLDKF